MTPEEARWLEKYFGPDVAPFDSPEWVAKVGLEEILEGLSEDSRNYEVRLAANSLLDEIKWGRKPFQRPIRPTGRLFRVLGPGEIEKKREHGVGRGHTL